MALPQRRLDMIRKYISVNDVALNNCSAMLKKKRLPLDIQIVIHVSIMAVCFIL